MLRQKSELTEKSISLGGCEELSQAMRESQKAGSKRVEKNQEPRAEKMEVIQA